uniref:Uncharacterized protein n=1 Tax=Arundo donax TaxID=35708 RepID=A0A0A8ZJH0_ARUDO
MHSSFYLDGLDMNTASRNKSCIKIWGGVVMKRSLTSPLQRRGSVLPLRGRWKKGSKGQNPVGMRGSSLAKSASEWLVAQRRNPEGSMARREHAICHSCRGSEGAA